ncbi:MAG: type II toxin-antitoxin system VapC family toxin [Treponema sp.]|nr:type II toxin-antitoxin system VapC family toxin [Treponema sp.]
MNIILDTHIIIWFLTGDERLSQKALELIQNPDNEIYYSHASLWEIAVKHRVKKEEFNYDVSKVMLFCEMCEFSKLTIREIAIQQYERIPLGHSDPFDLMLIAQAQSEGMKLLTHDAKLEQFSSDVILV